MRKWWQRMLATWPKRRHCNTDEAAAAVEAANRSHERAVRDHLAATATRAEAEAWAAQVRNHNTANRFDSWLAKIVREGKF